MNYVRSIAESIRDHVDSTMLPSGDTSLLFDLYALLALTRGRSTTNADVHHAWVLWMLHRGETHAAMVPYVNLAADIRAEDEPFVAAIREVSAALDQEAGLA